MLERVGECNTNNNIIMYGGDSCDEQSRHASYLKIPDCTLYDDQCFRIALSSFYAVELLVLGSQGFSIVLCSSKAASLHVRNCYIVTPSTGPHDVI